MCTKHFELVVAEVSAWGSQSAGLNETETGELLGNVLKAEAEKEALCYPEGKEYWKSAITTGAAKPAVWWAPIPTFSSFLLSLSAEMCRMLRSITAQNQHK